MRKSFALILLAAAAAVLQAGPVHASCAPPDPDVVFEGTSAGPVDTEFEGPDLTTPYAFDVDHVIAGDVGDRVVVWMSVPRRATNDDQIISTSIDVEPPEDGTRYRVSANRSGDSDSLNALLVSACTGGIEAATSPAPKASNPGNAGLMAPLIGVGVILLLLVVAALAQRDKTPENVT